MSMLTIFPYHPSIHAARRCTLLLLALIHAVALPAAAQSPAERTPLNILHAPVGVAPEGQNIAVRARVAGGAQPIERVSLMWASSRDAAPFRVAMVDTGTGIYSATLPANLFAGLRELFYYLEARDAEGISTETPWYTVTVRPSTLTPKPASGTTTTTTTATTQERSPKWVRPALIGGGILLGGAAAYALTSDDSGGGSGGDSGEPPPDQAAGTYVGSLTECMQPQGSNIVCTARAVTFVIDASNRVSTSDLQQGQTLTTSLAGSSFVFAVPVTGGDATGEIQYVGTVIDTRIVGNVQGSSSTTDGRFTTYTGNFSASRR